MKRLLRWHGSQNSPSGFDRTYEGLKQFQEIPRGQIDEGFDRTYEGLKRFSPQSLAQDGSRGFDRTYEGLKHGMPEFDQGRWLRSFDRTYEGLKQDSPGVGIRDEAEF